VSKVERDAKMEGRRMTLVLQPDHKPAGAKPPVPGQPAAAPRGPMTAGTGLNLPRPPGAAAGPPPAAAPRPGAPTGPPPGGPTSRPAGAPIAPAPRAAGPAPVPATPRPAPAPAAEPAAR
jgi:hypothetical protein